jgi:hypothetical protein
MVGKKGVIAERKPLSQRVSALLVVSNPRNTKTGGSTVRAKRTMVVGLVLALMAAGLLTSCGEAELGSEENPIIWVFVPSGEVQP